MAGLVKAVSPAPDELPKVSREMPGLPDEKERKVVMGRFRNEYLY